MLIMMPSPAKQAPEEPDGCSQRMASRRPRTLRGAQFAQLSAFAAVAEHHSFTRAAEVYGLSIPSLSQAVRNLEDRFGVRLLNRTTRSVGLTEAGTRLLDHLKPVLEGMDSAIEAVNTFRDGPTGTLRISVHPLAAATIITPLIADFLASYPIIGLEVSVDFGCRDIVANHFDAGIQPAAAIAQDMIAVPVGRKLGLKTVASPGYLAANPAPQSPHDLRQHNCIGYRWDRAASSPTWKFQSGGNLTDVPVNGSLSVSTLDLALHATLGGVGIAQLPECTASPHIAQGRLMPVLSDWSPQQDDFFLFYVSRRHVPIKLRAMIDFMKADWRPKRAAG